MCGGYPVTIVITIPGAGVFFADPHVDIHRPNRLGVQNRGTTLLLSS